MDQSTAQQVAKGPKIKGKVKAQPKTRTPTTSTQGAQGEAKDLTDYDSSEDEEECKESHQIVIPDPIKRVLEYDCFKVKARKKVGTTQITVIIIVFEKLLYFTIFS